MVWIKLASHDTGLGVMGLVFGLLGPLEVRARDERAPLGAPMVRALLASLLLWPGQFVSVSRLAGALWHTPPISANANLRTYAARLREVLGRLDLADRLTTQRSGGGYRLTASRHEVDAEEFARLATRGRMALCSGNAAVAVDDLTSALALWRGRAGEDAPGNGALVRHLLALDEQRLVTMEDLAEARLAAGHTTGLVSNLRAIVFEHPLRERPWSFLMRALYQAGDPSAALIAFDQLRAAFREGLGIEPSVELQRLQVSILRRDDAAVAARPSPVPFRLVSSLAAGA